MKRVGEMGHKPHTLNPGDVISVSDEVEVKQVIVKNVDGVVKIYINDELKIIQGHERKGEDNKGSGG